MVGIGMLFDFLPSDDIEPGGIPLFFMMTPLAFIFGIIGIVKDKVKWPAVIVMIFTAMMLFA